MKSDLPHYVEALAGAPPDAYLIEGGRLKPLSRLGSASVSTARPDDRLSPGGEAIQAAAALVAATHAPVAAAAGVMTTIADVERIAAYVDGWSGGAGRSPESMSRARDAQLAGAAADEAVGRAAVALDNYKAARIAGIAAAEAKHVVIANYLHRGE